MDTVISSNEKVSTPEKAHIGNAKIAPSGKAVKIHIFEGNHFFVIPSQELNDAKTGKVGRIFEYSQNESEIVGEITAPKNGSKFYRLSVKSSFYYLKNTYVDMLLNGSTIVFHIREE